MVAKFEPDAEAKVVEPPHKDFARRFASAIDGHPDVPALNYGRLGWFVAELEKRGVSVTPETVRKWSNGYSYPRKQPMKMLAQILQVDEGWLAVGQEAEFDVNRRRTHSRLATSGTNILAGLIQADGGHPAFPQEGDASAESRHIDLYAVIRGINYSFHVAVPIGEGDQAHFSIPADARGVVVLVLVPVGRFSFKIYELDWEALDAVGTRKGGIISVKLSDHPWREIETFAERL